MPTLLQPLDHRLQLAVCRCAADTLSSGSGSGSVSAEEDMAEAPPTSCNFAGLRSTAPASPSTATVYQVRRPVVVPVRVPVPVPVPVPMGVGVWG